SSAPLLRNAPTAANGTSSLAAKTSSATTKTPAGTFTCHSAPRSPPHPPKNHERRRRAAINILQRRRQEMNASQRPDPQLHAVRFRQVVDVTKRQLVHPEHLPRQRRRDLKQLVLLHVLKSPKDCVRVIEVHRRLNQKRIKRVTRIVVVSPPRQRRLPVIAPTRPESPAARRR